MPQEKGKRRKAQESKVQANLEDPREDIQKNRKGGRGVELDTSRQSLDGESLTKMSKIQTAARNGGQPESEAHGEGVWIVGNAEEIKHA